MALFIKKRMAIGVLRQEMNLAYFDLIHRPGEKLGVLDNGSDFECCAERTHCNCTHGGVFPKVVWNESKQRYELDYEGMDEQLKTFGDIIEGRRHTILSGAEHNNVYFPGFYAYRDHIPQALMQDMEGRYLELRDPDILEGRPIPMPAIDDPELLALYAEQLGAQAERMSGRHNVAAYVMGAEMLYPEYFGLGHGDYRPTSWKHFEAWCNSQGVAVPQKADTLVEGSEARSLWLRFREQAMADRASYYYRAILNKDETHLCFYPTHGSTLRGSARAMLGQQTDTLVCACDGIEMGHILIDDDAERRNVIMTGLNASYGTPVIIPRLGNKTPDLGMAGGGRSFTPATLRRFVYEAVGLGVSIIFPIHWRSHLHDGEWFIKNTPAEETCRKVFDELIAAAPYMQAMGRLQPQVGIWASDATWLRGWRMRWTALMQDMLAHHAHATLITDALIDGHLSKRMPLLLLVDEEYVENRTLARLKQYMDAGGKAIVWGTFAVDAPASQRKAILEHPNCLNSGAGEQCRERIIREMFLSGMRDGTTGERYRVQPVDFEALETEIRRFAPEVILHPFQVKGVKGEINVYPLTDRAALGCVCINHGCCMERVEIKPDDRLLADAVAVDMLTGQPLTMPVEIEPHGTRLIFFAKPTANPEELVVPAEDAFERWKTLQANVGALRQNYTNMRSGAWLEKRASLAEALLHSLALRVRSQEQPDGSVQLLIDAYGPNGESLKDADITVRLVPGNGKTFSCTWEKQHYVCNIAKQDRPLVYDPQEIRYKPLTGKARLIIQAECGELQGGCMCHVNFKEDESLC